MPSYLARSFARDELTRRASGPGISLGSSSFLDWEFPVRLNRDRTLNEALCNLSALFLNSVRLTAAQETFMIDRFRGTIKRKEASLGVLWSF